MDAEMDDPVRAKNRNDSGKGGCLARGTALQLDFRVGGERLLAMVRKAKD
jgi:hypothetical protein